MINRKITKIFMIIISTIVGIGLAILVGFFFWASSGSYPQRNYAEIVAYGEPQPSVGIDEVTIVSYNIGYLSGLTNNQAVSRDAQLFATNLQTAIAALAPLQPDVIGLQEIDLASHRSFTTNQVAALAQGLNLGMGAIAINWDKRYVPFPYMPPSAHFKRVVSGQAVLSRYPIQTQERIVLEQVPTQPLWYRAFYLDRLAQVAQIQLGSQPVVVINVHLEAFDAPTRLRQTQMVRQIYDRYANTYPVLLMGDFNSNPPGITESGSTLDPLLIKSGLQSAMPLTASTASQPLTFPSDRPIALLDYIFYDPDRWELLEARILTEAGQASDHLPVMARLRLR